MRKVSKDKYIIAASITAGIFFLGLFLGIVMEEKRVDYIQTIERIQKMDYGSLQLQYQYIGQMEQEGNCPGMLKSLETAVKNLEETRERIENYDKTSKMHSQDFELLKREYALAEIQFWLFVKKTKQRCKSDIATILYFFSDEQECPRCEQQAFVLTYLKKKFGDKLLIFSLDSKDIDEPMIEILKKSYNVEHYPTIVIEDQVFANFTSTDTALKKICSLYSTNVTECYNIVGLDEI